MRTIKDINANSVKVGSMVRVLHIDEEIIKSLPKEEIMDVNSMLHDVLEVYEIDEHGQAWVEKKWHRGEGQIESHSLGLSSNDMELVK